MSGLTVVVEKAFALTSWPFVSWVVTVRPTTSLVRVNAPTGFSAILTSCVVTRSVVRVVPRGTSAVVTTIVDFVASGSVPPPPPPPLPRRRTMPTKATAARKKPINRIRRLLRFKVCLPVAV